MKYTFLYLIIISLISCHSGSKEKNENIPTPLPDNEIKLTPAQKKNANIQTNVLGSSLISNTLKVNGIIDVPPQNLVSVSIPLSGYLYNTKLLPGMHVQKGEVLATIKDQQFIQLQQDYLTAKAKWQYASLDYKRQKELHASEAGSEKSMQQAQTEMNLQQINMNGLAEKLKLLNLNPQNISSSHLQQSIIIFSPINGYVSKVNANIGKYISPSDVLFELINPSDIHLNLRVFEKDVKYLFIGQRILAYTNSQSNQKFNCEIILISKDINPDGTVEVHCHFEQYDQSLLPGMYMNAEIEVSAKQVNTLPEESIISYEGNQYIFIAKDSNHYKMQAIVPGNTENGFTEILNNEPLQNVPIVTKGAYTLLMALKNIEE